VSLYPERVALIEERLRAAFAVDEIHIEDQSHRHAGHAGARSGGGHFDLRVVSPSFAGKTRMQRHRMVYAALGEAMNAEIHALSIKALAPGET